MKRTEIKRKVPLKRTGIKKKRRRRNRPHDRAGWNKTEAMDYCDDQWAIVVKLPGRCAVCGAPASSRRLEAHHLRGRQDKHHRHHEKNGLPLCSICHTFSSTLSAHGTPKKFHEEWLPTGAPESHAFLTGIIEEEREEMEAARREGRCPRRIHPNPTADDYRDIARHLDAVIAKAEEE